jgi:hypothetical protein
VRPRRPACASARPLNFTVRRQMHRHWRIGLFGAAAILLIGCGGADPGSIALLEHDSIHELAQSSASTDAMRTSLTRLGYSCWDASGSFATENGGSASTPRFVACTKVLSRSLFCNYRMYTVVVPSAVGPAPEVHVRGVDECL